MKNHVADALSSVCYYLGGTTMFLLFIVMLFEVAFRYIPGMNQAQPWVPGVLSLLDIWLIFLASVVAMRKNSHLRITFFIDKMPYYFRIWITLIVNLITLLIFLIIIFFSQEIVKSGMGINVGGVQFSKGYSFIALPVSSGLMCIFVIIRIFDSIKTIRRGERHV